MTERDSLYLIAPVFLFWNFRFRRLTSVTEVFPHMWPSISRFSLTSSFEMPNGTSRITPWHLQKVAGMNAKKPLFFMSLLSFKRLLASTADFIKTHSLPIPSDLISTTDLLWIESRACRSRPNDTLCSFSLFVALSRWGFNWIKTLHWPFTVKGYRKFVLGPDDRTAVLSVGIDAMFVVLFFPLLGGW